MPDIDAKKIEELLPCPFCGGAAQAEHFESKLGRWRWSIGCNDHTSKADDGGEPAAECYGFQSMTSFATKAEAIAAWNRRASHSLASASGGEDAELCERLEHLHNMLPAAVGWTVEERDAPKEAAARIRSLSAQLAEARRERDEAVNWNSIVDAHGDTFDDLASQWLAIDAIKHVTESISGVFKKWASADLLTRFQQHLTNGMHLSFVEGAVCGFRRAEARATASESEAAALRERIGVLEKALEPFAKVDPFHVPTGVWHHHDESSVRILSLDDFRRACTALEGRS